MASWTYYPLSRWIYIEGQNLISNVEYGYSHILIYPQQSTLSMSINKFYLHLQKSISCE